MQLFVLSKQSTFVELYPFANKIHPHLSASVNVLLVFLTELESWILFVAAYILLLYYTDFSVLSIVIHDALFI